MQRELSEFMQDGYLAEAKLHIISNYPVPVFGHVFEVTPDGAIVWEFFTPLHAKDKSKREGSYRLLL